MEYSTGTLSNEEIAIVIIVAVIGFFMFFAFFVNTYMPFKNEKDYIKREMARSFDEEEYLYWKRELKMLYISEIPIIRSIVRRKHKR